MAFSASAKSGLTPWRMSDPGEQVLLMGDPGVTYTKGQPHNVLPAAGLPTAIDADDVGAILRCAQTTICPANTVALPPLKDLREWDDRQAGRLGYVPFNVLLPAQQIYAASIKNYTDDTVTSYTASTRVIVHGTGHGANDRANGALMYIYDGAAEGELNIVEDYVHATTHNVYHRPFNGTPDTTSKTIVLAGATDANVVGPMGLMVQADVNDLDVQDGYDDGEWMVYPSWRDIAALLPTGALPVVRFTNTLSAAV